MGRFLSPDEKGEYRYASGQDAINWAWVGQQGADALWNSSDLYAFIREHRNQIAQSASQHNIPPELLCAVLCNEQEGTWGQFYAGINKLPWHNRIAAAIFAESAAQYSYRNVLPLLEALQQQANIYGVNTWPWIGSKNPGGYTIGASNVAPFTTIRELVNADQQGAIKLQVLKPSPIVGPLGTQGGSLIDPGFVFDRESWALVSLTFDVNNGIELAAANMENGRRIERERGNIIGTDRLDWLRLAGYHNKGVAFPEQLSNEPKDVVTRREVIAYMKRTDVYLDKCAQWLVP